MDVDADQMVEDVRSQTNLVDPATAPNLLVRQFKSTPHDKRRPSPLAPSSDDAVYAPVTLVEHGEQDDDEERQQPTQDIADTQFSSHPTV
jgi:hypothetical protein